MEGRGHGPEQGAEGRGGEGVKEEGVKEGWLRVSPGIRRCGAGSWRGMVLGQLARLARASLGTGARRAHRDGTRQCTECRQDGLGLGPCLQLQAGRSCRKAAHTARNPLPSIRPHRPHTHGAPPYSRQPASLTTLVHDHMTCGNTDCPAIN